MKLLSETSTQRILRPPSGTKCKVLSRISSIAGVSTTPTWFDKFGEQLAGGAHQVVAVAGGAFDLLVDVAFVARADLARRHQAFDIEAVGGFGGDPAGRGVGLAQVAHLLEVGHQCCGCWRRRARAGCVWRRCAS